MYWLRQESVRGMSPRGVPIWVPIVVVALRYSCLSILSLYYRKIALYHRKIALYRRKEIMCEVHPTHHSHTGNP